MGDEKVLNRYLDSGVSASTSILNEKKVDDKTDANGFNQLIETKENDMIRESLSVSECRFLTLFIAYRP